MTIRLEDAYTIVRRGWVSPSGRNSIFFIAGSFPARFQAASAALPTPSKEMEEFNTTCLFE